MRVINMKGKQGRHGMRGFFEERVLEIYRVFRLRI